MKMTGTECGYGVESSSKQWKTCSVDPGDPWCGCPTYWFRAMKANGVCKHIQAVCDMFDNIPENRKKDIDEERFISLVEEMGKVDSIELIGGFWGVIIDSLIFTGDLIEDKDMIRIMR